MREGPLGGDSGSGGQGLVAAGAAATLAVVISLAVAGIGLIALGLTTIGDGGEPAATGEPVPTVEPVPTTTSSPETTASTTTVVPATTEPTCAPTRPSTTMPPASTTTTSTAVPTSTSTIPLASYVATPSSGSAYAVVGGRGEGLLRGFGEIRNREWTLYEYDGDLCFITVDGDCGPNPLIAIRVTNDAWLLLGATPPCTVELVATGAGGAAQTVEPFRDYDDWPLVQVFLTFEPTQIHANGRELVDRRWREGSIELLGASRRAWDDSYCTEVV